MRYVHRLLSTVVQTIFQCLPRSSLHRQHYTHPPCASGHRNFGYRATYHLALPDFERSLGNGPPAYAHHHTATTKRRAHSIRPVRLAVADASEYHHGVGRDNGGGCALNRVFRYVRLSPHLPCLRTSTYARRILQREGNRDLFSHRPPAMPSDDDEADDGHDVVMDSSGEEWEQDDGDES